MGSAERTASILKYAQLGLKIQPIHWVEKGACSCGNASCKSAGKHPLTASGYMDASSDEIVILGWLSRWPKCNIGLTMGQIVGTDVNGQAQRLVALDIDPRNGGTDGLDRLLAKHGQLPDTATQLTQSGGFHYLLLAPASATFPGLLDDGVEVKTKNHINVYPSVGPKGAYEWEASADLLEGFNIAQCPEWMLEVKKQAPVLSLVGSSTYIDPRTVADLKEALPYIPADNYDDWIKVGQSLKGLGNQGFGLWVSWSQLSPKYDGTKMRAKWTTFNPSEINYQSVFTMAEQNGWVNNAKGDQSAFAELVAKANSMPRLVNIPQHTDDLRWLPACESLNSVSTMLQMRGGVRNESTGRAAALAMISHAAGRRYRTEFGDPVHIYQVLCAPSLGEIRHVKQSLFDLFHSASIPGAKQVELTTTTAIYQKLHETPALLYVAEKFAQHLKQSKRQFSGSQENAFATLSDVYEQSVIRLDKPCEYGIRSDAKVLTLHSPALTMLALLPEDQASELLSISELGRGSLEQYLFSFADPEQTVLSEPQIVTTPQWLKDHLERINDTPIVSDFGDIINHSEVPVEPIIVRFAVKPDAAYTQIMALSDHPLARNLLIGARGLVRRVASLLAIYINPETPVVDADVMDLATRIVSKSTNEVLDRLKLVITEDGKLSDHQKILVEIRKHGAEGITHTKLSQYFWPYKKIKDKEERESLIASMAASMDIVVVMDGKGRSKRFISTDFAVMQHSDGSKIEEIEEIEVNRERTSTASRLGTRGLQRIIEE
ncbi:MAG: hypothetical protein D4R63_06560 [Methylococcaceae bacterium]|nr:MAG: hypothetical protein D4R63_06560 [Methylococcaceae bacterium]